MLVLLSSALKLSINGISSALRISSILKFKHNNISARVVTVKTPYSAC
jgi:hypothetical protein